VKEEIDDSLLTSEKQSGHLDLSIIESLSMARIPKEFHSKNVKFGKYVPAIEKRSDWRDTVASYALGNKVAVVASGRPESPATEATYSLARGMVISQVALKCYSLAKLADMLENERHGEEMREIGELDCVVILGFYDGSGYRKCPLPPEQAHRMEWFIEGLIGHGTSLVLHCTGSLSTMTKLDQNVFEWWSPRLVGRLNRKLTDVFIVP